MPHWLVLTSAVLFRQVGVWYALVSHGNRNPGKTPQNAASTECVRLDRVCTRAVLGNI